MNNNENFIIEELETELVEHDKVNNDNSFNLEIPTQLGAITFKNYFEIKENALKLQDFTNNFVINNDSLDKAKDYRANLNKIKDAIDKRRIEIERAYKAPLTQVSNQLKEIVTILEDSAKGMSKRIKEITDVEVNEKIDKVLKMAEDRGIPRNFLKSDYVYKKYTLKIIENELNEIQNSMGNAMKYITKVAPEEKELAIGIYLNSTTPTDYDTPIDVAREMMNKMDVLYEKAVVRFPELNPPDTSNTLTLRLSGDMQSLTKLKAFLRDNNISYQVVK